MVVVVVDVVVLGWWLLLLLMWLLLLWLVLLRLLLLWLRKWKKSVEIQFSGTAVWYFEHNSLGFENLTMGLAVLESLFYGLSLWCFEFLQGMCQKIVNQVLKGSSFSGSCGVEM